MVQVHLEAAFVAFADGRCRDDSCFEEITLKIDTVEQFRDVGFVEVAVQYDSVALDDLGARVGEPMGEVSVVRDNQQTLAVLVEAARAEQALALQVGGQQFEDCVLGMRVGIGAGVAFRLVHDQCGAAL